MTRQDAERIKRFADDLLEFELGSETLIPLERLRFCEAYSILFDMVSDYAEAEARFMLEGLSHD